MRKKNPGLQDRTNLYQRRNVQEISNSQREEFVEGGGQSDYSDNIFLWHNQNQNFILIYFILSHLGEMNIEIIKVEN